MAAVKVEDGVTVYAATNWYPDSEDLVGWECTYMVCNFCFNYAPVVTQAPMVKKNLLCPRCKTNSMN